LKVTVAVWDSEPLVPVTVTVNVPAAVEEQDSVEVWEAPRVMLVGFSVQVSPAEAEEVSVTVPVNPLSGATVMVEVPATPTVVETLVGLAVTEKSCTMNVIVAVAVLAPFVPITVTVYVAAVGEEHDSVDVPDVPVILVGFRVHVRPEGETVLVSVTVPPAGLLTVIVEAPATPALTVTLVGLAVRLRPVPTVTVTVAVCVIEPLVPVTVTVNVPVAEALHERVEV